MVEKLTPDPPHVQALAALRADLPIGEGSVSDWLDRHRAQVVSVIEGLTTWGQVATLLGIGTNTLVSWGVRRGLRTRKPRQKKPRQKKVRQVDLLPRAPSLGKVQVSRDFKGIKLTLTVEFLEEGP
jgi:hypothetical protein